MQTIQNSIPESKHFYLEIIIGGKFGAIARCEGGAFSNSGIIDLGGQTLIFDTFETPIEVEDLRVAGNWVCRNPITWIVNSHTHSDHWFGNQVFNENTITSSIYCEVDCEIREARKSFKDIMQLELSEPYDTWSVGSSRQEINCQ